jgi:hypothetical protein
MTLFNITSDTTTTLFDKDIEKGRVKSILLTNSNATTDCVVDLYLENDATNIEILSTLVNVPEAYTNARTGSAGGIDGTTGTFDAITNVEVGDEVVFYDPVHTTVVIPQKADPITVASIIHGGGIVELSSVVIAPDNAVAKFYKKEKIYLLKTTIPGGVSLIVTENLSFDNNLYSLKLKTEGGVGTSTPLSVIIK